jgi:hypothetical protein
MYLIYKIHFMSRTNILLYSIYFIVFIVILCTPPSIKYLYIVIIKNIVTNR